MNRILGLLIFAGIIIWCFFLFEKYMPNILPSFRVDDANTAARCQEFGVKEEGVHTLSYGDRFKQIVTGCW